MNSKYVQFGITLLLIVCAMCAVYFAAEYVKVKLEADSWIRYMSIQLARADFAAGKTNVLENVKDMRMDKASTDYERMAYTNYSQHLQAIIDHRAKRR